jgi:hypothetical protein
MEKYLLPMSEASLMVEYGGKKYATNIAVLSGATSKKENTANITKEIPPEKVIEMLENTNYNQAVHPSTQHGVRTHTYLNKSFQFGFTTYLFIKVNTMTETDHELHQESDNMACANMQYIPNSHNTAASLAHVVGSKADQSKLSNLTDFEFQKATRSIGEVDARVQYISEMQGVCLLYT